MKYKVKAVNAADNKVQITFPDLSVKFSNGYHLPLKLWEGEYIPLDVLDPEDIRKSLVYGSLQKYITTGKVIVEDDEITEKIEEPKKISQPIVETIPTSIESVKVVEEQKMVPTIKEEPITDLSSIKTFDNFLKLTYFLKLRFIRECTDKTLLQEILQHTDSPQLKNNLQLRLAQF